LELLRENLAFLTPPPPLLFGVVSLATQLFELP
jgi:hypothetical protein